MPTSGYRLRRGVSFCQVDHRTLFLDTRADRYFCLSPRGERAFSRLAAGDPLDEESFSALENLVNDGPLERSAESASIVSCDAIEVPLRSRLDEAARASMPAAVAASLSLLAAPLRLRLRGLHAVIAWLRERKSANRCLATADAQKQAAAAFARLRLVAAERNNCLTRSIAVADRLIGIGARPDLVIAVKLRPFYAHAWVQCDGWLVNDRHEFVRNYVPILVV